MNSKINPAMEQAAVDVRMRRSTAPSAGSDMTLVENHEGGNSSNSCPCEESQHENLFSKTSRRMTKITSLLVLIGCVVGCLLCTMYVMGDSSDLWSIGGAGFSGLRSAITAKAGRWLQVFETGTQSDVVDALKGFGMLGMLHVDINPGGVDCSQPPPDTNDGITGSSNRYGGAIPEIRLDQNTGILLPAIIDAFFGIKDPATGERNTPITWSNTKSGIQKSVDLLNWSSLAYCEKYTDATYFVADFIERPTSNKVTDSASIVHSYVESSIISLLQQTFSNGVVRMGFAGIIFKMDADPADKGWDTDSAQQLYTILNSWLTNSYSLALDLRYAMKKIGKGNPEPLTTTDFNKMHEWMVQERLSFEIKPDSVSTRSEQTSKNLIMNGKLRTQFIASTLWRGNSNNATRRENLIDRRGGQLSTTAIMAWRFYARWQFSKKWITVEDFATGERQYELRYNWRGEERRTRTGFVTVDECNLR